MRLVRRDDEEATHDASTWSRHVLLITTTEGANGEIEKIVKVLTKIFVADVQEGNKD